MEKFSYKKYKHIKKTPTWVYFKGVPVVENVRMENFRISQKENVVFKNCIFVNGKDTGLCLAGTGASFYNCIFAFNKGCGIYLCEDAHDFKFYDCVFANNEENGAYLNDCKDNYFYNCVFEDNKDSGVSLHGKMNMFRTCVFQNNIVGVQSLKKDSSEFFECRILDNKKYGVLTWDSS